MIPYFTSRIWSRPRYYLKCDISCCPSPRPTMLSTVVSQHCSMFHSPPPPQKSLLNLRSSLIWTHDRFTFPFSIYIKSRYRSSTIAWDWGKFLKQRVYSFFITWMHMLETHYHFTSENLLVAHCLRHTPTLFILWDSITFTMVWLLVPDLVVPASQKRRKLHESMGPYCLVISAGWWWCKGVVNVFLLRH